MLGNTKELKKLIGEWALRKIRKNYSGELAMAKRMYIPVSEATRYRLQVLASRNHMSPAWQAGILLRDALNSVVLEEDLGENPSQTEPEG